MPRPDPAVLRATLKSFLGEEEYFKFLNAGVREPMRFWQERAWEKFIAKYPALSVTPTEKIDALDVCPAHECSLQTGFTESIEGMNFRPRSPEEQKLFPRASWLPVSSSGLRVVRYCQKCEEVQAKYLGKKARRSRAREA
jgi:hypothetical protein